MSEEKAILGTTLLEWRSAEDLPALHVEEYDGESWMQSEPLLLADDAGNMAVGYCQKSFIGTAEFDTLCCQKFGEVRMWALIERTLLRC